MSHDELEALVRVADASQTAPRDDAARVALAEDRQAIRDLIMAYGYLEDARRWDEMLSLYTEDIVRVLAGSLVESVQGKPALRARLVTPAMEAASGRPAAGPEQLARLAVRHLIWGDVVRVAPDRRTATAAVQYTLVATADGPDGYRRGSHEGSYVFEFRREDGRWKFCRQVIVTNNAHNPMFAASTEPSDG